MIKVETKTVNAAKGAAITELESNGQGPFQRQFDPTDYANKMGRRAAREEVNQQGAGVERPPKKKRKFVSATPNEMQIQPQPAA